MSLPHTYLTPTHTSQAHSIRAWTVCRYQLVVDPYYHNVVLVTAPLIPHPHWWAYTFILSHTLTPPTHNLTPLPHTPSHLSPHIPSHHSPHTPSYHHTQPHTTPSQRRRLSTTGRHRPRNLSIVQRGSMNSMDDAVYVTKTTALQVCYFVLWPLCT